MASRRLLVASLATLRASRGFLPHASRRRHFGAPRAEEDYIESTTNALVKRFKRCHRKKHRDAENVVLVEGRAFVAEVLARGDDVEAVLVADDVTLDASLLARAKRMARAPDFVLKAASTTDSPQGCVALVARPRSVVSRRAGLPPGVGRRPGPGKRRGPDPDGRGGRRRRRRPRRRVRRRLQPQDDPRLGRRGAARAARGGGLLGRRGAAARGT